MTLRRAAIAAIALLLIVLAGAGGAIGWLMTADLKPLVERKAGEALGRAVTVESFRVDWGSPLGIELHGLKIANAPWGSAPDMVTIDRAFALIDVAKLLDGVLRYDRLEISKPAILLERDTDGVGNWKFGSGAAPSLGHIALVPKDRSEFPTLIDFKLQDAKVTYRTSSGKALVVELSDAEIASEGDDTPVTVTAKGAYNGLAVSLKAGMDSFTKLRQAEIPYGTSFSVFNEKTAINFRGTMMQPIDFDGVAGALTIDTRDLGELLTALDAGVSAAFPASLAGALSRNGDHWKYDSIEGELAGNTFAGSLALDEGPRGGTDHIAVDARFPLLDLDRFAGGPAKPAAKTDLSATPLDLPGKEAPAIDARIRADRFKYGSLNLSAVAFAGSMAPGRIELSDLNFAFAGSTLQLQAAAKRDGKASHVTASAALLGADVLQLAETLGAKNGDIAGRIDARADLEMTGATLGDALADSSGHGILSMTGGSISRDLLEKAATDLRTLFRKGEGMSPIDCLLAVVELKNGIATIAPLALKTPEAELTGGGKVDLVKRQVDLTVRSDPKSTGFFALDIPIHVSGPFANIAAAPAKDAKVGNNLSMPELPPAMSKMAAASACLKN